MEYRYKLLTFGIPVNDLPDSEDGSLDSNSLSSWIRLRNAVDRFIQSSNTFSFDGSFIECPTRHDILFSRGGNAWSHMGNVRFRYVLESRRQEHADASNNDVKARIITEIVELLDTGGYRFLVWDKPNGWWTRISEPSAIRNKVAVAMRDHSKRIKERAKVQHLHQTNDSTTSVFSTQYGKKRKQIGGNSLKTL
jgi:hypothetical protein